MHDDRHDAGGVDRGGIVAAAGAMHGVHGGAAAVHPRGQVRVWDIGVRIAHWVLAGAFVTAYLTEGEDDVIQFHVWAGYAVAAIVVWRALWGFVGPEHARFSNFVRGPGAVFAYLRSLVSGGGQRFIGHNPAGAAMVLMLLLSLAITTGTGMTLYAVEEGEGPLAGLVNAPADAGEAAVAERRQGEEADEGEGEEGEGDGDEWLEEVHELFANLSLFLVLLHIGGVVVSSVVHRENLPRSMVTGNKAA